MRKISVYALLITGAALLVLLPNVTTGQGKGKGKGGFGGGGFNGGGGGGGPNGGINPSLDPEVVFNYFAKGKSYITVADTEGSSRLNYPLKIYAQEHGLANAQISLQQFRDFFAYQNSKSGMGQGRMPGPGGGGFKMKMGGGNDQAIPIAGDPAALYPFADAEFKKRDANGDGKLNSEEMSPTLRANLDKWDKNGDGLIDMNEYRAYYVAKMQGSPDASVQGNRGIAAIIIDEEDLDRKPVVFRVGGKQPPGLPDWFNRLDTDKDGQVALYEWRVAGKSMDDFKTWDLNDDGFITAEEASKVQIQYVKDNPSKGGKSDSLASIGYQSDGNGGERPSFRGGGDRSKGQGGGNPFGGFNPFKGKGGGGDGNGKGKGGGGDGNGKGKGKGFGKQGGGGGG